MYPPNDNQGPIDLLKYDSYCMGLVMIEIILEWNPYFMLKENKNSAIALRQLENDKDNLIKDNVTLIKENEQLRRELLRLTKKLQSNDATIESQTMKDDEQENTEY